MPEPRKIKSVTVCTQCGSIFEGITQPDEALPCGHAGSIFAADEYIIEALKKGFEPLKPVSKANARMLVACGRAWQIRSMSNLLGLAISYCLLMGYFGLVATSVFMANLFLAGAVACAIMEKKGFPGKMIADIWANKLCPANAYDKIRAYVESDI